MIVRKLCCLTSTKQHSCPQCFQVPECLQMCILDGNAYDAKCLEAGQEREEDLDGCSLLLNNKVQPSSNQLYQSHLTHVLRDIHAYIQRMQPVALRVCIVGLLLAFYCSEAVHGMCLEIPLSSMAHAIGRVRHPVISVDKSCSTLCYAHAGFTMQLCLRSSTPQAYMQTHLGLTADRLILYSCF